MSAAARTPRLPADPFTEQESAGVSRRLRLLGADFAFQSRSRRLLRIVDAAYRELPRHRVSARAPSLRVKLVEAAPVRHRRGEPPPLALLGTRGLLGGATAQSDVVMLSPRDRCALVVASPRLLSSAYHARYELIEFAVFTLATRAQRLVPLHAACVGLGERGLLLLGDSGAGKSTTALHCVLNGLEFLAEDGVFVTPGTMRATGIGNFLHVTADAVRWLERPQDLRMIAASPVIRRRSGVRKVEIDMRHRCRLSASSLQLDALVFLSTRSAGRGPLLRPLPRASAIDRLESSQAYARSQPQWPTFLSNAAHLPAFELRRGSHPRDAAAPLRGLLECDWH